MKNLFFFFFLLLILVPAFGQQSRTHSINTVQQRDSQSVKVAQPKLDAVDSNSQQTENQSPFYAVKGKREVVSKRDAFSKTFVNEDGSFTALIGAGPIHYKKNGQYLDIDPNIVSNASAAFPYANTTNMMESYFGATTHSGVKTKTVAGEVLEFLNLTMYWEVNGQKMGVMNATNQNPVIEGDKAAYKNIYGQISAEFTIMTGKRKLDYVIPNPQALGTVPTGADYLVFTEDIILPFGWTHSVTERGILINNNLGQPVLLYENPVSTDAAVLPNREQNTVYESFLIGNTLHIKTKVNTDWLLNSERVFPVRVDPTTNVNASASASVYSDGDVETTGYFGLVANTWLSYFIKFNTSSIPSGSTLSDVTGYINQLGMAGTRNTASKWSWANCIDPSSNSGTTLYNSQTALQSTARNMTSTNGWKNSVFTATGRTYVANAIDNLGYVAASVYPNGTFNNNNYYGVYDHTDATRKPYLAITYTASACSGTPNGGTGTINRTSGTFGTSLSLTAPGATAGTGITYQWESAPSASGPWSNISGATSSTYNFSSNSTVETIYYRLKTTCTSSSSSAYSSVVSFWNFGCSAAHTDGNLPGSGFGYVGISNVNLGTINNTTGYQNNSPAYNNYTNLTTNVQEDNVYTLKVTYKDDGSPYNPGNVGVWVDWNSDGDFNDTNEFIGKLTGVANNSQNSYNLSVPVGTSTGTKIMRVRSQYGDETMTSTDACTTFDFGETEDYSLNVLPAPTTPKNITFHNYGGTEQLTFNNSRLALTNPVFRLSHTTNAAAKYQIQISTSAAFAGLPSSQTFTGTYPVNTEQNFTFTNSWGATNNTTYYVRVRAAGADNVWSSWTTETFSFTYQTPKDLPDWFQTTQPQFQTDILTGTVADANHDVMTGSGNGNVIVNGDFANTSGWTTYKSYTNLNIELSTTDYANCTPKPAKSGKMWEWGDALSGDMMIISQQVDLTGVDQLTYDASSYYAANATNLGSRVSSMRFIIGGNSNDDSGTVLHTTNQAYTTSTYSNNSNCDPGVTINTTSYTGIQRIKFVVKYTGTNNAGVLINYYVSNVVASTASTKSITSSPISLTSVKDAIKFGGIRWNQTLGGGTLTLKVQGSSTVNGTYSDIVGYTNITQTGDGEKFSDLTGINPANYPYIRLVGTINGQNVKLHDWAVEFQKDLPQDCETATTWTGTGWSNGFPTDSPLKNVIFEDNYTVNAANGGDIRACSLEIIKNNVTVTVANGSNLFVLNDITVADGNNAHLILENDTNLIQTENLANNSGTISVKKEFNFSANRKQYNLIMSPVEGQDIRNIFGVGNIPFSLIYNEATDYFVVPSQSAYSQKFGFASKEPVASVDNHTATYTGGISNGTFDFQIKKTDDQHGYNLIGNPYPSNIDLKKIYSDNNSKIQQTFYLWDNRGNELFEQLGSGYSSYQHSNYALFNAANGSNGTGTPAPNSVTQGFNPKTPTRYLSKGVGFLIQAKTAETLSLNNSYRTSNTAVSFTGKTNTETEDDRYWLSMTTPIGLRVMTALTYFEGGDNGFAADDSEGMGGSDEIFTMVDSHKLAIQGKSPFLDTDVVKLGHRAWETGIYKFEIFQAEGVFANGQTIYIRDKALNNAVHNLSNSAYYFKTGPGEVTDRFEIIYRRTPILSTSAILNQNPLRIDKIDHNIVVTSDSDKITEVEIFSLSGIPVYKNEKVNSNELKIPNKRFGKQLLVVVAKTDKGEIETRMVEVKD